MKHHRTVAALALAGAALMTGCANMAPPATSYYPVPAGQAEVTYGTIDSIQLTRSNSSGSSGTGAVMGGLVGALAGNQVGSGSGRTAATLAGAVGGAMLGNEVEKNRAQGQEAYQISVRLDNGDYRTVVQDSVQDLRVGSRVRVAGGRVYRD